VIVVGTGKDGVPMILGTKLDSHDSPIVKRDYMFKDKNPAAPMLTQRTRNEDAVFVGWQKSKSGEVFALYSITAAGHPSLGSTVTDKSLLKLNLQIPLTPIKPVW